MLARDAAVLGFLAAATVLAALADTATVFDVAGAWCARLARGRTGALWLLVAALATVSTVLLSLDTTVVLLTPVVLATCARTGLRPLPFAYLVVWLANAASLLLPVSNLTNLLAVNRLDLPAFAFARRMLLPEVAVVVLAVGLLTVLHARDLTGGYDVPPRPVVQDRVLFAVAATGCLLLGPAVIAGAPPWAAASVDVVILGAATVWRGKRDTLSARMVPWKVLVGTAALFAVITGLTDLGLSRLLHDLIGGSAWRTVGVGAALSNVTNNLPAYLALEPAVHSPGQTQLLAALIGCNVGPLVIVTGSVATLLWREQCRRRDLTISVRRFALVGVVGAPVLLAAATGALLLG